MERFDRTYRYKFIYVFSMPYESHRGMLKVGESTVSTDINPDDLVPGCHELNQAAKARIDSYTTTASLSYRLEYTELAMKRVNDSYTIGFKDTDVHRVLINSGVSKVQPNGISGNEWFRTDLDTVKAAIKAVKASCADVSGCVSESGNQGNTPNQPIEFREEQIEAIEKTLKVFKKDKEMLWNAKMRFGKTLSALETIRRSQYRRVIIITHRPVVDAGWSDDFDHIFFPGNSKHEYCYEKKTRDPAYVYDEKTDKENDTKIKNLDKNGDYFIYFASIQDLRGSKKVGGKYNKNNAVFALDWDLIVIDEAHEGTQTELGDSVIKALRKKNTRVLALSGTPFNILGNYNDDNVFTWDYIMEQTKKVEWDKNHHGDHNPYADLPKMHIYTYDLGEKLRKYATDEYDSKAFNFREFFRTWHREPGSTRVLPEYAEEGKFVHESDVKAFLDMMTEESCDTGYPYSTKEYRDMFRHTLWVVPGVKEAKALSELLRNHPVFCYFGIANVAGKGDDYEQNNADDALQLVKDTIENNKHSITLSCGKLTTGVTVKEWSAVLMLAGSYSTAASQYMQTIFRVQSAGTIDGKQKTDCYVFDFAPDRTLKVMTEAVNLSRKPGKNQTKNRQLMADFLNFCPVIAISGSKTKKYSVESMMEQIKQIYAERAVNSGFEDNSIYNDELLKLGELDAENFNKLKKIIGSSKASTNAREVKVNGQGLTDEQLEAVQSDVQSNPPRKLTPEEIEARKKLQKAKEARKNAISILRGISIRMPLLIYGADVDVDEDIDIERFVNLVDKDSWEEFMPTGVTKRMFNQFAKYYDRDVFIAAGKRIRRLAASAEKDTPTRRVMQIAEIFSHFKNPDKETVLTPWRVVNMHMAETIGGWCFYNDDFQEDAQGEKHRLTEPRFVDQGTVTKTVFGEIAKILEINSKTGLYPLYVAYSFYRQKLGDRHEDDMTFEECWKLWDEVLRDNVYVICKTPMAKTITIRTLCGYKNRPYNAHYFKNLVNMLKEKPKQFKKKILKGSYWDKDVQNMKFDAVVGNPPYQVENEGNGNGKNPIYHLFIDIGRQLSNVGTFIHPGRFLFNAGKTPKEWNYKMLHDKHYKVVQYAADSSSIFPTVDIKGGVAITYWDENQDFGEIGFFSPYESLQSIVSKVVTDDNFNSFSSIVYPRDLYKLAETLYEENPWANTRPSKGHRYDVSSNVFDIFPELFFDNKPNDGEEYAQICGRKDNNRCLMWIKKKYLKTPDNFDSYKVFIPKSNGSGAIGEVLSTPVVGSPVVGSTLTFLSIGKFDSQYEAEAVLAYIKSKFARVLLGSLKVTQDNPRETWAYVPLQNFTTNSDIDWSQSIHEIDLQLYKKYHFSNEEIDFIENHVQVME